MNNGQQQQVTQRRPATPQQQQQQYGSNVGVATPRKANNGGTQQQTTNGYTSGGQLPPSPATLPLNYKTPEQAYRDALNFSNLSPQQQQQLLQQRQLTGGQDQSKQAGTLDGATDAALTGALMQNVANQNKIRDMLKRINDSRYMYPAVAVITLSLVVIITMFQRSVNFAVRCLLLVLLILFIAYTAYQFRGSVMGSSSGTTTVKA